MVEIKEIDTFTVVVIDNNKEYTRKIRRDLNNNCYIIYKHKEYFYRDNSTINLATNNFYK